ncbi:MAG: PGF-CTERM sorting domain-containing protein, partial [Haloarculaceae archaeon]
DDGEDTETTEGESGPGFGIIVSVLALLGAALLAARRNN